MYCRFASCHREIADDAVFCPYCGRRQEPEERKRRRTRRANGTGAIYKLPGQRSRPWLARYGNTIIGYYPDKTTAVRALDTAVATNTITDKYNITLGQVHEEWKGVHYKTIGPKAQESYDIAWKRLETLAGRKMRELRSGDYQAIITIMVDAGMSESSCQKVRNLISQLSQYAIQNDIITRNYAEFLVITAPKAAEKDKFTAEEIKKLWDHALDERAQIVLTLIHTGFRINELFSLRREDVDLRAGYITGGEKTDAGKNRIVPIHPKVMPFVRAWMGKGKEYLIPNSNGGKKDPKNFRGREFYPLLIELGILDVEKDGKGSPVLLEGKYPVPAKPTRLTPHCTRHTFASLMSTAGVTDDVLIRLIGHSDKAHTERYIHKDLEELREAINHI